jgi:hypothetical protein
MARSIQEILNYTSLTKSVLRTAELPNPFPAEFMSNTEDVIGNTARYRLQFSQRKAAPINTYGAPAKEFQLIDVGDATAKLVHNFESMTLGGLQGPILWNQLQSLDAYVRDGALQTLRHQLEQFGRTFGNHRIFMLARMLRNGVCHYDINGNPLPSSTGAVYTVTNNVNANNQTSLNGIVTAGWNLANTNIPLQVLNLRRRTKRLSGLPLEMALFGENLMGYLSVNSFVQEYLAREDKFRSTYIDFAGSELPANFLGIPEWRFVGDAFYTDIDDTNQDLWGGDDITFCPKPTTGGWHSFLLGTYWCPTSLQVFADGVAAMESLKPVQGLFSYAKVEMNPPGVMHLAGDTALHCFKTPDAIFQADVTP